MFVVGDRYDLVDCPVCRPAAILAQERHQKFLKEVEEAGGLEEFQRKSREWVMSIAAARSQRPRFEFPDIITESDFEKDVLGSDGGFVDLADFDGVFVRGVVDDGGVHGAWICSLF